MSTKVWGDSSKIDPNFVNQRFSIIKPFEVFKQFIYPSPKLNPSTFFYYPKFCSGFQAIRDSGCFETLKKNGTDVFFKFISNKNLFKSKI